jgi:hypothetical protein
VEARQTICQYIDGSWNMPDYQMNVENGLTGVALLHPVPSLTLYTDSSLHGWGAFLEGKSVSGVWSLVQQQEHINPPTLEKRRPNVPEERTGEFKCEGAQENPHRLENSETPEVERIVEP